MNKKTLLAALAFCGGLLSATNGYAALESRLGGDAVYDTVLNITWATNANINGTMHWTAANTWAAGLTIDGVSGWRLPSADPACGFNYNCTGSEMGELFYNELGGTAGLGFLSSLNAHASLFTNLQSHDYWSGTEYAPVPGYAWDFNTYYGDQGASGKSYGLYALAVRSGDVAAVPEPETYALMLAGLGLIGLIRRRRG